MIFTELHLWLLIWVIIVGIFTFCCILYFYIVHYKKRHIFLNSYADFISLCILWVSLIFLLISLLGPRYISREGNALWTHIAFVLDVSHSMNVVDVWYTQWTISRLDASKKIIWQFMTQNQNNQYALSIFSWDTQKVIPFSWVSDAFLSILNAANNKNVWWAWTDIGWAISGAVDFFHMQKEWGVIVVFTDWWDEEIVISEEWKNIFKERNIQVFFVGVWSNEGDYIPLGVDVFWNTRYAIYQGKKVVSRLHLSNLEWLAHRFGFDVFELQDMSSFSSLQSELKKIGRKVHISQEGSSKSLWFVFIVLSWILFFFVFFTKLFSIIRLWRKK